MIPSTISELSAAVAARRLVHVTRRDDLQEMTGFPLAMGGKLLLLRDVNPDVLLPDGYVLVRLQDVTGVRSAEWDRSVERALAQEGRVPDPADAPALRLDGWAAALGELHARGEPLALDCEDEEEGYYLGAITTLDHQGIDVRHITTEGAWEDEDWSVDYDTITRVVFRSRYVEVFSRLAGPPPDAAESG